MFTSMPNPDLYAPLARIIDDEETVRNSEAFMLRMGGINAVVYESAEEFLARDDLRHPGCLVLDVRMPGMSGLELQEEMTRRESTCRSSFSLATATSAWRSRPSSVVPRTSAKSPSSPRSFARASGA